MSTVFSAKKKKTGRPRVDSEAVNVRLERRLLDPLDLWIAEHADPKPTRPEAIRRALEEWLIGQGKKAHKGRAAPLKPPP